MNRTRFTFVSVIFYILANFMTFQVGCASAKTNKKEKSPPVAVLKKEPVKKEPATKAPPKIKTKPKAKAKTKIPKLLVEVESIYSKRKTLRAKFKQTEKIKSINKNKKSSGLLYIKNPNKFRWETHDPDPSIAVTNGEDFWFYTPPFDDDEPGQLIIKKYKTVRSRLTDALLAGEFSKLKGVGITQEGKAKFLLKPRSGVAGKLKSAIVEIHPTRKYIRRIHLVHRGGNESEIELQDVTMGGKLSDELFQFKAPPGTEILDNL